MKPSARCRVALVAFAIVRAAVAASAPDSIAGMVYRETGGIAGLRTAWQHTLLLRDDGTFRYITRGNYGTVSQLYRLAPLPANGTYRYTKTGATTGRLILSEPGGTLAYALQSNLIEVTLSLDFAPPTAFFSLGESFNGIVGDAAGRPNGNFGLTPLSAVNATPLAVTALRGHVAPGQPLTVGFVVPGQVSRSFLIRAVGPSLAQFGVTAPWSDPDYTLYRGSAPTPGSEAHHGNWSADSAAAPVLNAIAQSVGAFPLASGSKDAVGVTRLLSPGSYTIVCQPAAGDAGGEVLIEVYPLP